MNNKIYDALDTVKAGDTLKASTMEYLKHSRQKRAVRRFRPSVYKTLIAVCAMLLVVVGIGSYSFLQTPVSYVSIDVNPSIELALNRFDRVVSATAFNKDGAAVLEGLSVQGLSYTEAIDQILESANMKAYLTDEAELVFTVAAGDADKGDALLLGIENCPGSMEHGGHSVLGEMDTVAEAHHNGLSLGKYSAYLELAQYDPEITVEDCHHMSMAQIHGLIRAHEKEHESEHEEDHGQEQGSEHVQEHGAEQGSGLGQEYSDEQGSEHTQDHERGHSDKHE